MEVHVLNESKLCVNSLYKTPAITENLKLRSLDATKAQKDVILKPLFSSKETVVSDHL